MKNTHEILRDLDSYEIMKYQQNRYPLFFLDFISEIKPLKYAKGHKNFSYNEWFFPAHFEDEPNVPGFIQIEALTQMFLMTFLSLPENKGKKTSFYTIKNAKFKKKIIPGDRLDILAELNSYKRGLAIGRASGYIGEELACQIELSIVIPDILMKHSPIKKEK